MLQLDNIATQDAYPGDDNDPAGSLSDQHSDLLSLDVAGAPVYVQFKPYDDDRQNAQPWSDEDLRIVAPKSLLIPDVAGVRVRSAEPGTPASVTAQLFEPDDPGRPSAASAAVQVVTTVGQIGVQHNGTLQDSENTLDLEDSAQILWTVTPDPTHGRVQVDAAIASSVALGGAPTTTTAGSGDSSTKIATTAFVKAQGYATLASPAFSGTPTATTPLTSDNSTRIATTAYVQAQGYVTSASAPVTSVFGRTGAIAAAPGDYTAAQVTNAFDLSNGATQTATGSAIFSKGFGSSTTTGSVSAGTIALGGTTAVRITTTDGSTVTNISGNIGAQPLYLFNTSGSSITFATGGGVTGLRAGFTLANGAVVFLYYDSLGGLWTPFSVASGGVPAVSSVFGRTGAVVATSGDYTAAQVTNAADTSSASTQSFAGGLTTAGALIGGAGATFVTGGGVTWTPNYATGNFQAANVDVSGSTTLTITTPSNGPSASESGLLMMLVENTAASGGTTLTWSGAFLNAFSSIAKPTSVSFGTSVLLLFVYQPTSGGWKCVAKY